MTDVANLLAPGSTDASRPAPRFSRTTIRAMLAAALALITWAIYARSVAFNFIGFDDQVYILNNSHVVTGLNWPNVRWALSTLFFANWHPLTWITYQAVYAAAGTHAGAYHAVNFVLHGCSAAMLFWFLAAATDAPWCSFAAAALFAWHPLRVESVAWVSETKDCLCCFFWLATMLAYQRYARRAGVGWYLCVLLLAGLALASKATAVTLPCALLLLDFWPLHRATSLRRWGGLIAEKIPLLIMVAAVSKANFRAQRAMHSALLDSLTTPHQRMANAVVSTAAYLRDTFWPSRLCVFYPHPSIVGLSISPVSVAACAAVLLAITAICVWFWRRCPAMIVGWLWFLGTLVPAIGLVQVGAQSRADRYTYIPSIGLSFALIWMVFCLLRSQRAFNPNRIRRPITAVAIALALALIAATEFQLDTWRDTVTVFTRANAVTDRNFLAQSELTEVSIAHDDIPQALAFAKQAVTNAPKLPGPHRALAMALEKMDQDHAALHEWELAVLEGGDDAETRDRLGSLLMKMDRTHDAAAQFDRALHYDPQDATALNNLGLLLAHQGKMDQAINDWRKAIAFSPGFGPPHGWLAAALEQRGDRAGAIANYRAAKADDELRPQWLTSLAWLLATDPGTSSAATEAIETARAACDATHNQDPLALDALAAAQARAGQFDLAAITAAHAANLARAHARPLLANGIERRMMAYRAGQPYIAPAAPARSAGAR